MPHSSEIARELLSALIALVGRFRHRAREDVVDVDGNVVDELRRRRRALVKNLFGNAREIVAPKWRHAGEQVVEERP